MRFNFLQATISEISTKLRTAPSERYSKLIKFSMPFKDFIFERVILKLFKLVNVIVEYMIDLPKRVGGIYESLPNEKKEGIEHRDKK